MRFRDIGKSNFSLGKTAICNIEKSDSKNLVKPVEFYRFWSHFRKMAPKMIKKPLVFSLLGAWESAKPENLIKPVENWSF